MPVSISSEEESSDEGEETNYLTSEACESRQDDQMAKLEDVKAFFTEDQELPVNTVEVSNCNSNFLCNRDISNLQPITVIYPLNHDLQTGESVERKKERKEGTRGALMEEGVNAERGRQIPGFDTEWEEIVKIVESMGFSMVLNENITTNEGNGIPIKKKRGKRELRNLRFDVNFKDSEFKRGTFNSK